MYCAVRANLTACAALLALGFVDVRHVVLVKRDCAEFAHVLATVSQATAASVGYFVAAHRALVARNVDYLYHIGVGLVAAHGNLDAFGKNCAFLVHTATHGGYFAGDDALGDVKHRFGKTIVPSFASNLTQNFVLQMLNFCIELSHKNFLL